MNLCKNMCLRFDRASKHDINAKFCGKCNYHIFTDEVFCQCCKAKYRTSKRWKNRNQAKVFCKVKIR